MTAASAIVLAPVSPSVAALLHQLQAQIIREAGERTAPPSDPMGALRAPVRIDKADRITYQAANGKDTIVRRRFCPEGWGGEGGVPWHPSHWLLDRERIDGSGLHWGLQDTITITPHVMDDFGTLVPVAT